MTCQKHKLINRLPVYTLLLIALVISQPLMASENGYSNKGFGHKNGYGHHDDHSGKHNSQKAYTRWRGPHKGCHITGWHHHRDHPASALNCLNAYATPRVLWPANHKFKTVTIAGLSTPSGQAPSVVIQCVSQDEPLNGQGDGNTDIDAELLAGNKIRLRKERAGGGNGRVYHIDFLASDDVTGESCTGSVAVEVPHHKHGKARDEGKLYPSLDGGLNCGGSSNSSPDITSAAITSATETVAYYYAVIVTDADNDTLGYSLEQAPVGMEINSEGEITWTPNAGQAGSYDIKVIVDDGNGASAEQLFTLIVVPRPNTAPLISSTPILTGVEEQAYQYQVIASDADGDALVYTLVSAPTTMTVSTAGLIQWAPLTANAGNYDIVLHVSDGQVATEQSYTLDIAPKPNTAPSITSTPVINAVEDSVYQYLLTATDPDGDILTFNVTTAPVTMVLTEGRISWVPGYSDAGEHTVAVTVSDGQGGTASQSFTVTVADTNRAPEITSTPLIDSAEGQAYQYPLEATDADGDALTYTLLDWAYGFNH